jgi:DNA-binding beta-propeller fold protein YncE
MISFISACDDLRTRREADTPSAPVGSERVKAPEREELLGPGHLRLGVERASIPSCRRPMGLAMDRNGRLLVACSLLGEVQVIDPSSLSVIETWGTFFEHFYKIDIVPGDSFVAAVGMAGTFFHLIDLRTGRHVERVNIGRHIADMKRIPETSLYLVAATDDQKVCVVDALKARVVREYEFPEPIGYIAVGKNGRVAAATGGVYEVSKTGSSLRAGRVHIFDPRNEAPPKSASTLTAGLQSREPVFVKNDSLLLVPNFGDRSVSVFDVTTREQYRRLDVQEGPERIVVAPEGDLAYCLNTRAASISVIQLSPLTVLRDIQLPANPENAVVSPDGKMLVVTLPEQNIGGVKKGNQLALIDLAQQALVDLVPAGQDPAAIEQSPDGRRVFVSNFKADSISVFE